MPSSDGSGQVWGALQTFGYQLISGGGGLMNAACLHHRHRRHSLCCSLHHGPPSPAIVHVPSARSLPLLVARLHALPSLCLPPASLTHTHPPFLSRNPLYTTTYLLASLCPFGLCPCPFVSLLQGAGAISKTMVAPIERIKVVLQVERGSGRAATAIGREILRDQVRQTGKKGGRRFRRTD